MGISLYYFMYVSVYFNRMFIIGVAVVLNLSVSVISVLLNERLSDGQQMLKIIISQKMQQVCHICFFSISQVDLMKC